MYPISDMLVQIMNAQAVNKESVTLPFSKMKLDIANVLKTSNYLTEVERKKRKTKKSEQELIFVALKYDEHGPAISGIKLISRPSRRMYIKASQIKPVRSGYGMSVISTPKGVMSSKEARKHKLGGEVLFEIW
ncbi:MAG: 30S ribosomal protein S8 [Candidatus Yanofskybacteria bacterium RIFCSPHIGHO2_01_FULL_43_42]|uniref:Small ribosomal subunit protein uS8 n=1 Tax=Candidatus Yanofskybacteria bacterium RIFCSPLOWO2_01_FULL_43_22 TaxID=1802695 RepID=A0A1F8GEM0_9BACT|nr:MAG: 30S ribosomal protein S8 [Candidatus Yanofskybacteria bacterium RIFCSPHIGHO2_01_FULL_43_42]OGN12584.1 MAG: 30S ribosomal protein S8 [Candidatus Yanofskybacteria bacterium RIFCSPHIGHO2_02_FULL_43_17]OGN23731.1 MAG: 30S ribosomal protein S8 [Candidatus Yanofskybacteria bacterium RIFCSPLOWO2_01_FULL_43_22]